MHDAKFKAHHPNFLLLARKSTKLNPRIGFVVAKKKVKLAVSRNRIKRVTREAFRHSDHVITLDIVFLAKAGLGSLPAHELRTAVNQSLEELQRKASRK